MEDIRISIRLTAEEHEKFKLYAVKKKQSMNQILVDFVKEVVKEGGQDGNS